MKYITRRTSLWLGAVALLVGLFGCSSTPTWDPGAPDAMTAEHYALTQKAIDAKSKQDAQAALYLLRADVMRMRTNTLEMQLALARLYGVTNAVDKEDWTAARTALQTLQANYGRQPVK
jgi:hypothetical protein